MVIFLRGRNTFQGICLRSSQKLLKKLYFSEFVAWLRKAAENFWEVTCTSCMCSKACLDSYLSAKTNDMVIWYFKQFLESETCGNGDFRELVFPQEGVLKRGFMVIATPLTKHWTPWLWVALEKNLEVIRRNGLHFRTPLHRSISW